MTDELRQIENFAHCDSFDRNLTNTNLRIKKWVRVVGLSGILAGIMIQIVGLAKQDKLSNNRLVYTVPKSLTPSSLSDMTRNLSVEEPNANVLAQTWAGRESSDIHLVNNFENSMAFRSIYFVSIHFKLWNSIWMALFGRMYLSKRYVDSPLPVKTRVS